MALNFPNSPNVNDTYTNGISTWIWDGVAWNLTGSFGPTGPTGPSGAAGATGATGPIFVLSPTGPVPADYGLVTGAVSSAYDYGTVP